MQMESQSKSPLNETLQGLSLPKVNVEGHESGDERIDPSPLIYMMQMATAVNTAKLRRLEQSKVPIGTKSFNGYNVSTTYRSIRLDPPWISLVLVNYGPENVYLKVNELEGPLTDEIEVRAGESRPLDFIFPIMTELWVCTKQATSKVKIDGVVGQWR